jgi:hypothetical protein
LVFEEKRILIISDDENSLLVRRMGKMHFLPLVRKSTMAAIDLLKRHEISVVIVDRIPGIVDPIEFILNIRDFNTEIPIFLPDQIIDGKNREALNDCGSKVYSFKNLDDLYKNVQESAAKQKKMSY